MTVAVNRSALLVILLPYSLVADLPDKICCTKTTCALFRRFYDRSCAFCTTCAPSWALLRPVAHLGHPPDALTHPVRQPADAYAHGLAVALVMHGFTIPHDPGRPSLSTNRRAAQTVGVNFKGSPKLTAPSGLLFDGRKPIAHMCYLCRFRRTPLRISERTKAVQDWHLRVSFLRINTMSPPSLATAWRQNLSSSKPGIPIFLQNCTISSTGAFDFGPPSRRYSPQGPCCGGRRFGRQNRDCENTLSRGPLFTAKPILFHKPYQVASSPGAAGILPPSYFRNVGESVPCASFRNPTSAPTSFLLRPTS